MTMCYKNQEPDLFSKHDSEKAVYLEYDRDQDGNACPDLNEIPVSVKRILHGMTLTLVSIGGWNQGTKKDSKYRN